MMNRHCIKLVLLLASLLALGPARATNCYRNTAVVTGYWTDPASWCTDAALTKSATSYPKSTGDNAYFNASTAATVLMTNKIAVATLDLSKANLNLTFKAEGPATGQ